MAGGGGFRHIDAASVAPAVVRHEHGGRGAVGDAVVADGDSVRLGGVRDGAEHGGGTHVQTRDLLNLRRVRGTVPGELQNRRKFERLGKLAFLMELWKRIKLVLM